VRDEDREVLQNATYFHYCWAAAHGFAGLGIHEVKTKHGKVVWAKALADELLRRQRPDGSWVNSYTDAAVDMINSR